MLLLLQCLFHLNPIFFCSFVLETILEISVWYLSSLWSASFYLSLILFLPPQMSPAQITDNLHLLSRRTFLCFIQGPLSMRHESGISFLSQGFQIPTPALFYLPPAGLFFVTLISQGSVSMAYTCKRLLKCNPCVLSFHLSEHDCNSYECVYSIILSALLLLRSFLDVFTWMCKKT